MTPKELATRHPRLYHVTEPGAWNNIKQHGLLSTSHILDLYEIQGAHRTEIVGKRRPQAIALEHPQYGRVVINDNVPMSEQALLKCLDDNLTPADWLGLLSEYVFFWPDEANLQRHLQAKLNRFRSREVIVIDTVSLAEVYVECMALSPINSGSTIRKPARRGLKTFTPLLHHSFNEWRKLRGGRDDIREVVVQGTIKDITSYVLDVYQT